MNKVICWDLVPDIIRYIPLSDLRDLSQASPLFDVEISRIGIHVLYLRKCTCLLNNSVLVRSKGYVFLMNQEMTSVYCGTVVTKCSVNIIEGSPILGPRYYIDNPGKFAVRIHGDIDIYRNIDNINKIKSHPMKLRLIFDDKELRESS